jgi:two-component system, chemotaxis family, CheB/CheR fusion protein
MSLFKVKNMAKAKVRSKKVVPKVKKAKRTTSTKTSRSTKKKAVKNSASAKITNKKKTAVKKKAVKKTQSAKPKSTPLKIKKTKTQISKGFSTRSFPVVGIGASAGGLEAFEDFFAHMDPKSGIAFVVVTHQHPGHTSVLPELLRKCTSMDVVQVTDQIKVKQNCVYLNPPGKIVSIFNGKFHISESTEPRGLSLPIDYFFRSLAQDQKDKAICIILSGTGTDGTLGLRAVKGESGMAIVQEESSAKFTGMPGSALTTGLVDYILPPSKMPAQLLKYVKGPFLSSTEPAKKTESPLNRVMEKIFLQLRNRTGHDFSGYKSNTTRRRIERRMNVHHINKPKQYLQYLQDNPQEANVLFKELLIGVTAFFRDPDAFAYLREKLFPKLLKSKEEGSNLRIWVPGCASGEEVYSLAMLFSECQSKLNTGVGVQIFGTDLDAHAIDIARAGFYPDGIAADMSPSRLKTYFDKEEGNYRIRKSIRDMVIFAPQNVIKDPPFTKLDFISCRNLLIYLESDLQRKLLSLFHYSLNHGGYLFLGNSESSGTSDHLFNLVNKKWKVYAVKSSKASLFGQGYVDIFETKKVKDLYQETSKRLPAKPVSTPNIQTLMEKHLLSNFAPASVVVDDRGGVFYIHGQTGDFLEPAQGRPSNNLLSMAREGLKIELATALRKAYQQNGAVLVDAVSVRRNGGYIRVNITVQKILEPELLQGLFLVVFESLKKDSSSKKKAGVKELKPVSAGKMEKLESELAYTKESLQSTIEELETTNEELKSTNEELQSTNEELQSSNEEIETSKEEMQSLNEELQTTNAELQAKIDEYSRGNDDMKNLLNSTNIATLFLDNNLNVKRFTKEAKKITNLIDSDVGRPISDIVSKLEYNKLSEDCNQVLKTLAFKELEVQSKDGLWYQLRILPYRTAENKIDGLVVTFIDINALKQAERQLKESGELKLITDSLPILIAYVDAKQRYRLTNKTYEEWFGLKREKVYGKHVRDVLGASTFKRIKSYIEHALKGSKVVFETELPYKKGGNRKVLSQYIPHVNEDGKVLGFFNVDTEMKFLKPEEK